MTSPLMPVVIFDLDGTLVDSAPGIAAALDALGLARHAISVETVRGLVSFGAERLVGEALSLPPAEIGAALVAFRERYALDPCRPDDIYPGVRETLTLLKASGLGLGVCTNKPQRLAETVIGRLGLASLLPVVVGSAPDRKSKPDPGPLLEAIAMLALGTRAVLVGDSMVDAATAAAARIPFIHVTFGYGTIDAGMACVGSIEAMSDLPSALAPILQFGHADAV